VNHGEKRVSWLTNHDGHIRSQRAAIGYIIDPARQGQGIAAEAVSAMLDFCFGELSL
jgi:[ribosomal protein S5]-alanine N-acetyltransferase